MFIYVAATFIAIAVADLSECQPFSYYWQLAPDPGPKCRQSYTRLLTMGVANIVTDMALVTFPILMVMNTWLLFKGFVCVPFAQHPINKS